MNFIKSIVIVGGGSSGWMTAAYLRKTLFDVPITVIESKRTPTIGVGEASVPPLTKFMASLGHPGYGTWLPHCEGSIKMGIMFEDWLEKGNRYWHGYEPLDYVDENVHTGHCWLNLHRGGDPEFASRDSFYDCFFPTSVLNAKLHRAPTTKAIAYNLNANLFGEFLRKISPSVQRIQDDVRDVVLNERGEIAYLETEEHGRLEADLFIDCTGFGRKIIKRVAPDEPFQSYADSLFCNRAVVLRYAYESEEARRREMLPCAIASAQSAGWIWTIPQYGQIGYGYVYSSNFLSDDQAEMELRKFCGEKRVSNSPLMKVKFESGKLKNMWVKNCVAIGLAGGFIEPLESTGLAITQMGVEMLGSILDSRCYDDFMVSRYNAALEKFCSDVEHFIIAHYVLTNREDTPFWKAVKYATVIPELLQARFEVFRKHLPSRSTKGLHEPFFFGDMSWFAVLLGMNFPFDTPRVSQSALIKMGSIRDKKRKTLRDWIASTPSHYEHMRNDVYCANADDRIPGECTPARNVHLSPFG